MNSPLPSLSVSTDGAARTSPFPTFSHSHVVEALATARRLLADDGAAQRVLSQALVGAHVAVDEGDAQQLRQRVILAAVAEHRAGPAHEPEITRLLPRFQADGHHVRPRTLPGAPPRAPEPKAVRNAIERLPREHRLVLLLHDVEGLGLAAAARCLGVDVPLARARLHQARLALCELLGAGS
ncbi:MAG: sigma-70 family RNA polymerase sigma factor [Planctomycetes bacterium]|nr:sigma-70 family RNA polymerase sigma factor [Planctomycetota bacterium]